MYWRFKMQRTLSLLLVLAAHSALSYKTYNGYKLLRVVPQYKNQVTQLKWMEDTLSDLDFWTDPALKRTVDINVPPYLSGYVKLTLLKIGLTPEIIQNNMGTLIKQSSTSSSDDTVNRMNNSAAQDMTIPNMEKMITGDHYAPWAAISHAPSLKQTTSTPLSVPNNVVGEFARYNDILTWIREMVNAYSNLASFEDIGYTFERRPMRVIKVGTQLHSQTKPVIWMDSGIHAREWLTVGTTVWIINKMLTAYDSDREVRYLLDTYDWYFLPVANPDGYEYSHSNDRLWRKTRSTYGSWYCKGADPNRNWSSHWGGAGTSSFPCSNSYRGVSPFSEKCTQNMRDIILREANRIKLYIALHSYSQLWLTPWGWGSTKPSDYFELLRVANAGNRALKTVHGTNFRVGTPKDILYAASGGAYDWAKAVAGIKYSYTFELRPNSYAYNGFVVPKSEITPSGQEIWAALAQIAEMIYP